jgi:hypothetical protein
VRSPTTIPEVTIGGHISCESICKRRRMRVGLLREIVEAMRVKGLSALGDS